MAKKNSSKVHDKLQRKISGMPPYLMLSNYVPNGNIAFHGNRFLDSTDFSLKTLWASKIANSNDYSSKNVHDLGLGPLSAIVQFGIAKVSNERISKKWWKMVGYDDSSRINLCTKLNDLIGIFCLLVIIFIQVTVLCSLKGSLSKEIQPCCRLIDLRIQSQFGHRRKQ
jgi:hypothetical protein